jgi:hypothetical protein
VSNAEGGEGSGGQAYPATVADVLDHGMVVLNRGASHGVREGQRFLIYELDDREIEDPESGETLGRLERVKATGTVVNVQERMCTVELGRGETPIKRHVDKRSPFQAFPGLEPEARSKEAETSSDYPETGDKAKPIRP